MVQHQKIFNLVLLLVCIVSDSVFFPGVTSSCPRTEYDKHHNTDHSNNLSDESLLKLVRDIIPPLTGFGIKGDSGHIAIFGGSDKCAGAPYFAAISALRTGADSSHIFCPAEVAPILKSYSPDLIVHPIRYEEDEGSCGDFIEHLTSSSNVDAVVVGPGVDTNQNSAASSCSANLIRKLGSINKPTVIDASALDVLAFNPDILLGQVNHEMGPSNIILTPNAHEFPLLCSHILPLAQKKKERSLESQQWANFTCQSPGLVEELAIALGNVTIFCKGSVDIISNGQVTISSSAEGSLRRVAGIGDLLAGTTAVFLNWATLSSSSNDQDEEAERVTLPPSVIAAYGASRLIREAARLAFLRKGRSMLASDLIKQIHPAFDSLFPMPLP